MNWGTMVAGLLADMGRPPSDSDKVKRCIVLAIRQHAHQHFWFNEAEFSFSTIINQENYSEADTGFPKGLVSILSEAMAVDVAGAKSDRRPIYRRSQEYIEACRAESLTTGVPEDYGYYGQKIHLHPTPDTSTHIIRGRAVVDQWTPIVRYEAGVWKFYKPLTAVFNAGAEITDLYPDPVAEQVNPWLTASDDMISLYAQYLFWSQMAQATDGQDQRSQMAYVAALTIHQDRTSALLGPYEIEPYPIGGD